jgi:hypothetical protein
MAYELRIPGHPSRHCETQEEAQRLAREALRAAPDVEPEVIDLSTGRPAQPAGSTARRDDLANKVGY